jgi:hypothetical protein
VPEAAGYAKLPGETVELTRDYFPAKKVDSPNQADLLSLEQVFGGFKKRIRKPGEMTTPFIPVENYPCYDDS